MKERGQNNKETGKHRETDDLVARGFENLKAEMEAGHSERYLNYLDFISDFHRYSPYNQMLIFAQNPDATLVAGYRAWQKKGYQVRRGERGIKILAPIFIKDKTTDEEDVGVSRRLVGFKVVHVFDASQLTEPVETFLQELPDDAHEQYDLVHEAVMIDGIAIGEGTLKHGVQGVSRGGAITLREGLDSRTRTHVLIHEWAHELLHWGQEEEEKDQSWRSIPKPVRECQVESVSYIVSKHLGIPNPNSRDYILHYTGDTSALVDNLDVIADTGKYMIGKLDRVARQEGQK